MLSGCIFSEEFVDRPSAYEIITQLDAITQDNFILEKPNDYIVFSERIINQPANRYFKKLLEKDSNEVNYYS